jgi:hypothetical protein
MNMFKEAAVQMAKGGYAKNKKVKYFDEGGDVGEGPFFLGDRKRTDAARTPGHYWHMSQRGEGGDLVIVRIGSKQDTSRARMLASKDNPGWNQGLEEYVNKLAPKPYDVRVAESQAQQEQKVVPTGSEQSNIEEMPQAEFDPAAEQVALQQQQQQQYSQQVAAQMQNQSGTMPMQPGGSNLVPNYVPADYSGMTYEHAVMRQAQRDVKSPEEQRAINAALRRGPMGGGDKTSVEGKYVPDAPPNLIVGHQPAIIPDDPFNPEPAPYKPSLPPIYQAPYLSGTHFTPVGQYVQDPITGQPVAQAYNPLNQGYGAAAANFQQQIQGGYGTPYEIQNTTLTQNRGGYVEPQKFAVGGTVTNPSGTQAATPTVTAPTQAVKDEDGNIVTPGVAQFTVEQMYQPGVPVGGTTIAAQTQTDSSQNVATGTGEVSGKRDASGVVANTTIATGPTTTAANTMQATQAAPGVDAAMKATQAAQMDPNDPRAQVTAAQQTTSAVGNLQAAQGNASLINNPVQRQIQQGELISGVADAATASAFTAQVQAAQATPTQQATVQGQLDGLMQQFQGGATPPWAAGAMRAATAAMAARGLGASSLAGQAIVQAAMESALPIAQADAATQAQFEGQNLSNRQQRAMLAAQQRAQFMGQEFDQAFQSRVQNSARIGDIANMNFTAEQQVQLENSRAVNTMNLNNLSNSQAMVMAEASALAQLDTQNLNNRQQTAVQNAQSFLQTDMANLSNRQQTELFKSQQRVQSMFTDQAATNAARQFNATSQNQTDQFFQNLGTQVSQFNATQTNAQAQFNAGESNAISRFNSELNNQRDQFNAQNQLVIAQSNAQWRRQVATADTAAVNRANELNANAILDISKTAYNNLWNYYGDTMEWAWKSAESELERMNSLAMAELSADAQAAASAAQSSSASGSALGSLIGTLGSAWIKSSFCWVAREVYGPQDYTWLVFRNWMFNKAPRWLYNLYGKHGESFAEYISDKPILKRAVKFAMDSIVKNHKMEYKRANN